MNKPEGIDRADAQEAQGASERSPVERITEVLRFHEFDAVYETPGKGFCAYTPDGYVCEWHGSEEEHPAHVAAAVLAALELTEEQITASCRCATVGYLPHQHGIAGCSGEADVFRRWVSPWVGLQP